MWWCWFKYVAPHSHLLLSWWELDLFAESKLSLGANWQHKQNFQRQPSCVYCQTDIIRSWVKTKHKNIINKTASKVAQSKSNNCLNRPVSYSNGWPGSNMKWRLMQANNLHLKRFARISLYFMLDPVQPWEFENGLLSVCYIILQTHADDADVSKLSKKLDKLKCDKTNVHIIKQ